jgi:hypothetical protein
MLALMLALHPRSRPKPWRLRSSRVTGYPVAERQGFRTPRSPRRAIEFYESLGFEKCTDTPFGDG